MLSTAAKIGYIARDTSYLYLGLTVLSVCEGLNGRVILRLLTCLALLLLSILLLTRDTDSRNGWWKSNRHYIGVSWRGTLGATLTTFGMFMLAFWIVALLSSPWVNFTVDGWQALVGLLLVAPGLYLILREPTPITKQDA